MSLLHRHARARLALASLLATAALAGCGAMSPAKPLVSVYQNEKFQADEMFSRLFDGSNQDACEAARRALLGQGYVISQADAGNVKGSKRFQPDKELHVELGITVACLPDGRDGALTVAYATAQQEQYVTKKSAISTSVGVSALGSISIPTSSSQDALVKVASETVSSGDFYDRFFALMGQNLRELQQQAGAATSPAPSPAPSPAASASQARPSRAPSQP